MQPGLVYLRGLSTDKVFSLNIERVPHTENVVRPLTFALELSVAEAAEDLFMLRIAGAGVELLDSGFRSCQGPGHTCLRLFAPPSVCSAGSLSPSSAVR